MTFIPAFTTNAMTSDFLFTIYSPSITLNLKNILLILLCPTELQLIKANTLGKETSFFHLKLSAVTFIPAFTTNAMTSDFLSSISPGWVVMFLDYHHTILSFRRWLDLLGVVLAFFISILKIFKSLQNYFQRVTYITSFEINIWKVLQIIL